MNRAVVWTVVLFVVCGLFAPLIANSVPIVAKVNGAWRFPAFQCYVGDPDPGPDRVTWKRWRSRLPSSSEDWAWMPLIPYGPFELVRGRATQPPELGSHYFGNDDTGRDVLSRMIHGTQTALWMALGVLSIAMLIGVPLGAVAGYYGGVVDVVVSSLIQLFLCFPAVFFVLVVMAFLGNSLFAVILVLGLLLWTAFARIVRSEVQRVRGHSFVLCAEGLGIPPRRVLRRHILPAVRGPIMVQAASVAATAIVIESTLSFLGLGPSLATVSWGRILREGQLHAASGAWHLWLFPSLVLIVTVVCLHTVAESLGRDRRVAVAPTGDGG